MTGVFWFTVSPLFKIISLPVKHDPARPTIAYTKHMSREPQDDGYTLIPTPEKSFSEGNESDISLTFESTSDAPTRKKTPREVKSQSLLSYVFTQQIFLI